MELDFDRIAQPIEGDKPAGEDLRLDIAHDAVFRMIKSARNDARTCERQRIRGDADAPMPDWSPLINLVPDVLATKSKDLELACWLSEALIRQDGFAGLANGFKLITVLVENFWDHLHPMPDEDGMETRVGPLDALNGRDGDGTLIDPINNVPLTEESVEYDAMPMWRYQQANLLEEVTDPIERQPMIDSGMPTRALLDKAEDATSDGFCRQMLKNISDCLTVYRDLNKLLEEKCGVDEVGMPLTPSSSRITRALEACQSYVEAMAERRGLNDEAAGAKGDGAGAEVDGGSRPAPGKIATRQQAFKTLLDVARFFKETEPHSPVSYALERVVKWGELSLPELLAELIDDDASRSGVFRLVGIPNRSDDME